MSLENPDQTQPFRAPQDEIQWGILLLTKQLQNRDLQEREQYLQELWEWARQRADLLRTCPKIIESTFERVKYGFTTV
jgi:hypothetical protein